MQPEVALAAAKVKSELLIITPYLFEGFGPKNAGLDENPQDWHLATSTQLPFGFSGGIGLTGRYAAQ